MTLAVFLAAIIGVPCAVGLPVAFHRTLRGYSFAARTSLAWATGSLAVAAILTVESAFGFRWSPWFIIFITVLTLVAALLTTRTETPMLPAPRTTVGYETRVVSVTILLIAAAGLLSFAAGAATSADLSYFWGVKAVHFALERGIDFDLLRQPYMIHLHPNYPPLWPVLLGWGSMIAGSMPWLAISSLTWICLSAAAAVIFSVLETRLGMPAAAVVTCFWYGVLMSMATASFSGGNADGFLLLCVSIALVVILTEPASGPRQLRWVAAIALAGAVFTKSEGGVVAALIIGGTTTRDLIWKRPRVVREALTLISPAFVALAIWAAVRITHDLPLADPIREKAFVISFVNIDLVLRVCGRLLATGPAAVGWFVPLISLLLMGWRPLSRALPGLATAFGVPLFAVIYYLHAVGDPLELIVWTFPRLIQTAVSAWILGLGVVVFSAGNDATHGAGIREAIS
jgi:hypothetical protein